MPSKSVQVCPECRFRLKKLALKCRHCKRETDLSKRVKIVFYSTAVLVVAILGLLAVFMES